MKISAYPKTMRRKEQYSAGDLAILFGVSHRTAAKLIDTGAIPGFTVPGSKERRVLHTAIEEYVKASPQYNHVLAKFRDNEES